MDDNTTNFLDLDETVMDDVDFFAAPEEETEDKTKNPKDAPKPEDSREEEEEEQEEEEDLFNASDDDEEEEEEEEEDSPGGEEEEEQETSTNLTTLQFLKDKGLIQYELEEDETLDDIKAEELLEDGLDDLFDSKIEDLFEDMPDIVKEINKFVLKGGDINEFLSKVSIQNKSGLTPDMDLEDVKNQEVVIKASLEEEGYDKEYIDAQIEFLKDSNRLEKHAETYFNKWKTKREKEQNQILKAQDAAIKKEKEQRRALKNKVVTFLEETEEVEGFSVTREDRKSLPKYMSDRTVKLENGNQITGMQRDLMRVLNSPTGSVQIAKLLKSANEKGELSFDEIQKDTTTKVVKKVREDVRRNKKRIIKESGSKPRKKMRLADYFD